MKNGNGVICPSVVFGPSTGSGQADCTEHLPATGRLTPFSFTVAKTNKCAYKALDMIIVKGTSESFD
jgi:hypothetical protein